MATASPPNADDARAPLAGRCVLVGVTGGIAAYKTAPLVSRLVQSGADVRVVMTQAATRFVGPVTFQSLSGHAVQTSIWDHDDRPDSQHVGLARWADAYVIAPATAGCIAKLAAGFTPDPVTLAACALPAATPLLLAPAMNADMWANPIVQRNLDTLRQLLPNLTVVGPDDGWQACRTSGSGRMAEPDTLYDNLNDELNA